MRFDSWDICDAYYMYAVLYHEGQGSWAYKIFARLDGIGYTPGRGPGSLALNMSPNAKAILKALVRKHKKEKTS
jgi:hypothetical protein